MEEFVGGLWHRFVTRAAGGQHAQAAVSLRQMESTLAMLYRAFGGDPGLRLGGAAEVRHGARRNWLARLAGSDERRALASIGAETLRLPATLDCFPTPALNRDLYLWLAALAGCDVEPAAPWFRRNQAATLAVLERFPGLRRRYRNLVAAQLAARLAPAQLPPAEAAQEQALRHALEAPGEIDALPDSRPKMALQPVMLWLSPDSVAPAPAADATAAAAAAGEAGECVAEDRERTHRSERVAPPQPKNPFILMFRAESLLTWGEYMHVNRALDDDPDPDAGRVARDMDILSLTRGGTQPKSRVRFDLDLPSAAADDIRLGDGIPLPEWDYRLGRLVADHCRLQPMLARDAVAMPLPEHLRRPARRLRQHFAALAGARRWQRGRSDGEEIDLDACVRFFVDHNAGAGHSADAGLYASRSANERDLACLLLADLSMSTDAWVSDRHRVIDVIRDSAYLFCEALAATGDRFGVYGFSSVKRSHVRLHVVKDFAARYDALARGRIAALKPGYYTRMGAALRQASHILAEQPAARRLLLLLSDGKPNDLDVYDSRYGVEDTRMAIIEARRLGLTPFCVTVDREGGAYLPHLFGHAGYAVISDPEELPLRLPRLYARISGQA